MRTGFAKSFALVLLFAFGTTFAAAQVRTTGTLSGTVVDPSGATVPQASITVTEPSTGFTQTVTSSDSGEYTFPDLQPGHYQLTATRTGFAQAIYSQVVIEAARTINLQVQLQLGATSEKVDVSAEGQVLETTSTTLSTTINPQSVQDLPLNGRDLLPMAELVAGAQSGGDSRFTTYDALPNAAINITVDGINVNSQRYRTSSTGFYTFAPLRLGAFDEVTISTSELTADAGAEGSSTVRFVTKRGTNDFHGNLFWESRNSFFNANTFTNNALGLPKAQENLNDFGGSLGGPFWRNHIFFFVNYEQLNQPGQIASSVDIPTPQAASGLFSYIGTDGATHTVNLLQLAVANGFPGTVNSVMATELSQIAGFASKGSISAVPGLPYEEQLNFLQHTNTPNKYPTTRLDWQITPKISYHGSWDLYWRNIANTEVYPGDSYLGNGFKSTYYVASNAIDWAITPHIFNQASFGVQSNVEEFNPGDSISAWQSQGNLVINTPYLANGTQLFSPIIPTYGTIPQPRNNPLWNIFDNMTWTTGNHTFTFGGDLRLATMHETEVDPPIAENLGLSSLDPALSMFTPSNFPAINTGNGNQDLINAEALYATLVGRIASVTGNNYVSSATRQYQNLGVAIDREAQNVGGLYFQDSWRVSPHFALNYGLRWQFSGAIHSTNNLWTNPTYADLLGPSSGLFQPGVLNSNTDPSINLRPYPYGADLMQPSPNLGFAWNPDFHDGLLGALFGGRKTVIRGGASISRYDEGWTTVEQAAFFGNPGATQSVFYYPGYGAGYFTPGSLSLGNSIGGANTFPSDFTFPLSESGFAFSGQPFSAVDPNIRSPYVEQWNFGIQRQLPGNTVLEVNYVGNHAVHMWMYSDLNETNIFENGFLNEFQNAQHNLALNGGSTFADNTGVPGLISLPIFDAAFGGAGSAPGSTNVTSSFTNPNFITLLQQGQAGALANQLAISSTFLCNMVGNGGGRFASACPGYGAGKYPINFFQANPYAAGSYIGLLSDPGSESYNGLQVQVKHPVGHGLMFNSNYTWSHSFTNRYIGDYYTADEAEENFVTLRDMNLNRGPSPYDLRQAFRTYLTYDLPIGKGKALDVQNGFLNRLVGGWTVGSVVTIQSGRPFKLLSGYNTFNYSNGSWPDATDSGVVLNGITRSQLQNAVGVYNGPNSSEPVMFLPASLQSASGAASSAISPETTPGALGSMIYLYGPGYWNVDMSVHKSVPLREHVSLNIWAEFLNAFNHPNWTVLDNFSGKTNSPAQYANITSNSFAALTLANQDGLYSRNIQFRVQLQF